MEIKFQPKWRINVELGDPKNGRKNLQLAYGAHSGKLAPLTHISAYCQHVLINTR